MQKLQHKAVLCRSSIIKADRQVEVKYFAVMRDYCNRHTTSHRTMDLL